MRFHSILFDLDGTLSESAPGLTKSVQYALQQQKIEEPDLNELLSFIGPPLSVEFRRKYGMSDACIEKAVLDFRVRYKRIGLFETNLYPGTDRMLQALHDAGLKMAVATGKPTDMAVRVLDYLKISQYFDGVFGPPMDVADDVKTKSGADSKQTVIRNALAFLGADKDPAHCAMVGDRCFDIEGALKTGTVPVGVDFGYGTHEELLEAGCPEERIASSMEELTEILLA